FIGLDVTKDGIRSKALEVIKEIQFFPKWGEARLQAMMENRPDWCVSRQRIWGVPIPIFYCIETGEALADYGVMMKVADAMEKGGGIDAYHNEPVEKFVGPEYVKGKFGSKGFKKGRDILDVWFDSGICHAAVQKRRENMGFPADIYIEGSDQHRGWFNTSLLSSIATNDVAPFKALVTHGFVNDSEGKKMSKSKGNTVDPQEVSSKSGAEIIRLWSVYEDYGQDLTCGPSELERVTETYRRIRNTMRYLLGATYDFDPKKNSVPYAQMTEIDQWALNQLSNLIGEVTKAYESYEFYKIYHALNHFFTVELSAVYLDSIKDRLYTWKTDGLPRRSSQTVLWVLTDNLLRLMAPVLSFLAEEVYQNMPSKSEDSIFLHDFPAAPQEWTRPDLATKFGEILKVRTEAAKVLEGLRQEKTIGASLEASVTVYCDGEALKNLTAYEKHLREFFIVSEFKVKQGAFKIEAVKAPGEKCVRCWHYSEETGKSSKFPGVCPKCVEALS
ncbi:MAG: class I tRNA ligase family protein, partial [Pseudobdellovibrionaceae bacterium]